MKPWFAVTVNPNGPFALQHNFKNTRVRAGIAAGGKRAAAWTSFLFAFFGLLSFSFPIGPKAKNWLSSPSLGPLIHLPASFPALLGQMNAFQKKYSTWFSCKFFIQQVHFSSDMARSPKFEFYGGLINEIFFLIQVQFMYFWIIFLFFNLVMSARFRLAYRQRSQSWVVTIIHSFTKHFLSTPYSGLAWWEDTEITTWRHLLIRSSQAKRENKTWTSSTVCTRQKTRTSL